MFGVKTLRKIGGVIDRRYLKKVGATSISGSEQKLLLICFHSYEGKQPVNTADGIIIKPGDVVGELHLSNIKITQIAEETKGRSLEWQLMEMLKEEFRMLAKAAVAGLIDEHIKGFYGVNVLAAGAKRMGFTLIPVPPGWNRWWLGFWESTLRLIYYSFKTKKKAKLQRTMDPYEIWISRQELIRKYYTEQKNTG